MTGHWPFKKTPDPGPSSLMAKKKSSPKKQRNRPYINVELA
jgi:hypothetical protein